MFHQLFVQVFDQTASCLSLSSVKAFCLAWLGDATGVARSYWQSAGSRSRQVWLKAISLGQDLLFSQPWP